MSGIAKITNFSFNIMELLLQLIPYGYSNSGLPPQHRQLLLPLWFKMRTLWMVLWEEESVGTVQLRDVYQGVGSTDTAASPSKIARVTHSDPAMPWWSGLRRKWGGGVS